MLKLFIEGKYVVSFDEDVGEWRCTCPDFLFRKRECKHIRAVKEKLGKRGDEE
jgi:uncharacterized Zn finger protein